MAAKPGSKKKAGSTRQSVDAGDKDKLISELKNRIAVLENELRLKQEDATFSDTAERKRAEEALRESERNLAQAQAISHVGNWYLDPVTEVGSCSDEFYHILGIPRQDKITFSEFLKLVHTDDRARVRAGFDEAMSTHELPRLDVRIMRPDGEERFIFLIGRLTLDEEGRPQTFGTMQDITERKQAEEALKASDASLARSQAIAHLGNWELDVGTNRVWGSDELYRMFNLKPDVALDAYVEKMHPDDRAKVVESINAAIYGGKPYNIDYRIVSNPNEVCYVHAEGEVTYDGDGRPVTFFGTILDITECKRAEEEIQGSQKLLQSIIDNIPALVYIKDLEGRIFVANKPLGEAVGMDLKDVFGKTSCEIIPDPDIAEAHIANDRRVMETGQAIAVEEFATNEEGQHVFLSVKFPLQDAHGHLNAICGVSTDITERKRAEEALRNSESLYRAIGESIDYGVWVCAPDGRNIYASESFLKLVGMTQQQCSDFGWGDVLHPDDAERTMAAWKECVRTGGTWDIEHRYRDVDGKYHPILARGVPVRDDSGQIIYWAGINLDIGRRKRAEEELAAARDHLAEDLAGMSRLQEISTSLVHQDDMGSLLGGIIDAAIEITGADMGNIQLCNGGRELKIVESRGFDRPFLDFFNSVHENQAACGKAMASCKRVIVEDVTKSPIFVGTPSLEVMLAAGARAVQSTPLFSHSGNLIGMFSTHYRAPHRPEERELLLLDMLARQAADLIERTRADIALKEAKAQSELYVDLMGHDINNMNHSAMGYLELAQEIMETEKRLKLDDRMLIERPMHALANSSALISNVGKLQRLMAEGVKTKPTDLNKIFMELEVMNFHQDGRDVLINIQHVPGIILEGNELLKDVFVNLITNAVKHSDEEKPLTVNVKVEPVHENGQKYYRCMVEDNGPGIPDDLKGKLFHRFQRGTTRAHGKGLGLYLARTLVEGYNGKVWVEDRVHGDHTKGAKFVVMLPAAHN